MITAPRFTLADLEDWSTRVAPELAKGHDRRATGGWHITHAIEVARP